MLIVAYGIFSWWYVGTGSLHWELGVLATGLPGKSLQELGLKSSVL